MSMIPISQLFEIQCDLKLRRRSMVFLWVEVSICPDIVISLMPFLKDLLLQKKLLIMTFLPIQRSAALVLVLPSRPIYLDLRKNLSCGTGSLGSACIEFKNSSNLLKLVILLKLVMKCLLFLLLFSSLLQTSKHLILSILSIGLL